MLLEGILLKPAMVTPGADSAKRASPDQVADYTLKLLRRRVPPAVPGARCDLSRTLIVPEWADLVLQVLPALGLKVLHLQFH